MSTTTDRLCEVNGCQNKRSIHWDSDFRGSCCDSCMDRQRLIDGQNKRKWAREERLRKQVISASLFIFVGLPSLFVFAALIVWSYRVLFQ
jgi:hypothetical protein